MLATTFNLILKLLLAFFLLSVFFAVCYTTSLSTSPAVALVYLNQLPLAIESRVTNPNFTPSPRELECQKPRAQPPPQGSIPRIVHYVILSNEGSASSLNFPTFLSIKAVLKNIRPDKIKIHCYDFDTDGEWWSRISHNVELVHHKRNRRLGPQGKGIAEYSLPHQVCYRRQHAVLDRSCNRHRQTSSACMLSKTKAVSTSTLMYFPSNPSTSSSTAPTTRSLATRVQIVTDYAMQSLSHGKNHASSADGLIATSPLTTQFGISIRFDCQRSSQQSVSLTP